MEINASMTGAMMARSQSDAKSTDTALSRKDLLNALNTAFPGQSVSFSEFPTDVEEQKKLVMAGKAAALTISPDAAQKMQSDPAFRDKVLQGIKADQDLYKDKVKTVGDTTIETLAHGTVVDKDGNVNGWTLSKSETNAGDDDKTAGKAHKKTFLEALLDKLKQQKDASKLDDTQYTAALNDMQSMKDQSKSDDEIAALLHDKYLKDLKAPGALGYDVTA